MTLGEVLLNGLSLFYSPLMVTIVMVVIAIAYFLGAMYYFDAYEPLLGSVFVFLLVVWVYFAICFHIWMLSADIGPLSWNPVTQ